LEYELVLQDGYSNAAGSISFPHGECGSPAGGVNLTRKRLNEARQQAIGSTACGSFNS
jgi:hypothetical protein